MRDFLQTFIIIIEVLLLNFTCASTLRAQKENMKVWINATGDTVVLKFRRPHMNVKLEGYILGYGSSMFSKQFIKLPENGEPYITEMDAEPKYLIAVKSVKAHEVKKPKCADILKNHNVQSTEVNLEKPLHLVIGSVTPTSVLLSWGTLLKTPYTDTNLEDCIEESQFIVRYREDEPNKQWNYQTCPTTNIVIDNLKPDTPYEFGVRADTVSGAWSTPVIHKADVDIHELLKPMNNLKPQEPIIKAPQTFLLPVPVQLNITPSVPTPFLRHTGPPTKSSTTVGTGSDDITSSPSKDPLYLTETATFIPTPMSQYPSKATHNFQPQKYTISPYSMNTQHATQHTTRTSEIQSSSVNTQETTTETLSGRTKSQPSTTEFTGSIKCTTNQPKAITTKSQPSITQSKLQVPFRVRPTQSKPKITLQNHSLTQSSTTQLIITQPKPIIFQLLSTQPTTIQPMTTQPQKNTTQQKLTTTQPVPMTNPRTAQTPWTSQSRNSQHNSQPLSSTIHQQITTQPNPINKQATSILPQPSRIQRLTTSQQNLYITKDQSILINPKSTHESNIFYQISSTTQHQQTLSPKPFAITLNKDYSFTTLTLPTSQSGTRKSIVSQHPTSQYSFYDTSHTPSPIMNSNYYTSNTTEIVTKPGKQPQIPATFKYQPVPVPNHQPVSSTIHYYNITQWQYDKTESTPKSKSQVNNGPHSTDKHLHVFNYIKTLTSTVKSNVDQNSPWTEKQAINKKLPVSKPGRSILRKSSSSASVTHPSVFTTRGHVPAVSISNTKRVRPFFKNMSLNTAKAHSGEKHKGLLLPKPSKEPRKKNGSFANLRSQTPLKTNPNQVEKLTKKDKGTDLKQVDLLPILKPQDALATEKTIYQKSTPTATPLFAFNVSHFGSDDNSSVFSSVPVSDVDAMGKKRFVAPHVIYKTDKRPEEPCSVTHSLSFFPDEEGMNINVTGPPKTAPSNLTVVTVEGCPSFIILDWDKTDNETTEYEVTSSTKGPNGEKVSSKTTNQTHTAVENLKPESSYEFTVTPKNELGSGPPSEPVTFSTESADPRVSEISTGKNAIWSSFPFKADSYSECNGRQFVKRTWYRKFVGIQLCNSLRYKIYLSDSLKGKFYNIGDQTGNGEDHCQFVDSFLDGRTGGPLPLNQLPPKEGYFRAVRQEPVKFGKIGGGSHINYVAWYECGIPIPGSW
ncbi:target of Nesh-SH3 isoform X2 [Salminus brasiliensis]|uniref:target of Nesh-SH3 isoform X2 n=1 Tax=Salminus brasiliensis TaxID=930266 RepID=UPI003B834B70